MENTIESEIQAESLTETEKNEITIKKETNTDE